MSGRLSDEQRREWTLRQNYGPRFHGGLKDIELDARTAFVCWNMLSTVMDMIVDARSIAARGEVSPRAFDLGDQTAEELLRFVERHINPAVTRRDAP